MKREISILVILLAIGPAGAFAQQPQPGDILIYRTSGQGAFSQAAGIGTQEGGYGVRMTVTGADANVMFMGSEFMFESKPVKSAPYSAESVSETVQTLADGNRIVRSSRAKVYRDSEGRTRRESDGRGVPAGPLFLQFFGPDSVAWSGATVGMSGRAAGRMAGGVTGGMVAGAGEVGPPTKFHARIMINDPVSGVNYVLDPETHTAQKLYVAMQDPAVAAAVAKARQDLAATGKGSATINESGKTIVINMQDSPGEGSSLNPTTESLGTRTIEGVECEGTRTTFTIPAGQIGNDLPIVITNERWYSPKLQIVVLSERHDPRIGDTTFKLVGIDQSEPPASLFQVPPDYSIVDIPEKVGPAIREREATRKPPQ